MADVCGPFTLEDLDQFGDLDSLAFSLDSEIWTLASTCIFDVSLATTAIFIRIGKRFCKRFCQLYP
jgi:hypothetical protein